MDPQKLQHFLSVYDTGSFSRAASNNNVSQQAVSKSVAKLEETLAVRLFERGAFGAEPTQFGHALSRLRVPDKLVHLLLFTVRYLDVIGQEYKRMRRAMQARAFVMQANRHTWRSIGYMIGMLLVRALERSERVMNAMKCRGYQGRFFLMDDARLGRFDLVFVICSIPMLGGLAALNFV